MTELSEQQKEFVDDLAMQRVDAMNNDDVLITAIEQKVDAMESHIKTYFHERLHFHQNNKR